MRLFLTAIVLGLTISCTTSQKSDSKKIVLIHGAHLDGTSWNKVKAYLEEHGEKVQAPTLPGRDSNKNVDITTYAQFVCDQVSENSILVGHSQGGAVANQMVGLCPEKITKIIYVTAVIPLNGEHPYDLIEKRDEKIYSKVVVFKADRVEPRNKRAFLRAMAQDFDHKTSKAPVLYSEPRKGAYTAIQFDSEAFDAIPKAYVITETDLIITPQTQKKYIERIELKETYSVVSGHFPMVTKPEALADLILKSSSL